MLDNRAPEKPTTSVASAYVLGNRRQRRGRTLVGLPWLGFGLVAVGGLRRRKSKKSL